MLDEIAGLKAQALTALAEAESLDSLEQFRIAYLGKKGSVTALAKGMGSVPPEQRRDMGAAINDLKGQLAEAVAARKSELDAAALTARLETERVDITLPVQPQAVGRIHPVSQVTEEIIAIFSSMGFDLAEGPDVETDFLNFQSLNFSDSHPARDMHDTFYLDARDDKGGPLLLRTHTSPVQIRTMLGGKPPYRIIAPGRTYRCDSDLTHTPMFHQVEGLLIDKTSHMGHLKGCLVDFLRAFFERDEMRTRFRPSFFPFTEPSAEMDIGCRRSREELVVGEGEDWLEILGCGMVHPNVLRNCGLDPDEWQGFAFGLGIDRLAMLKYGIPDLRTFFEADLRWLHHYGFVPLDRPSLHGGLSR